MLHPQLPTRAPCGDNVLCKVQEISGQEQLEIQTKLKHLLIVIHPQLPQYHQRLINDECTLGSISCHLHLGFFQLKNYYHLNKKTALKAGRGFYIQTCCGSLFLS